MNDRGTFERAIDWLASTPGQVFLAGLIGGILDSPTVVVETAAATITLAARALQVLRGLLRDLAGGWVPGSQVWLQAYAEFAGPAWLPVEDHPNRHSMTLSLTVATQPL